MAVLSSLTKSATLEGWYVSLFAGVAFAALFLFSWLSEEFAQSEKWKKRRRLLLILAIIGCAGEQCAAFAEFAFSEHLQTLFEHETNDNWNRLHMQTGDRLLNSK